MFLLNRDQHMA